MAGGPRGVLDAGGGGDRLGAGADAGARRRAGRRSTAGSRTPSATPAGTPSTGTWRRARRSHRDHPRFAGHRHDGADHLCRAARPGGALRRRAGGARRRQGRPRDRLHADGARGAGGDAGLRPHRRGAFGGVRRLRGAGARGAHRRRAAEGDRRRLLRDRAGAGRRLQAAGRRGDRARRATSPSTVIVLQREQARAELEPGRDLDWEAAQAGVAPAPCAPVGGMDPLYILYTSGTTGQPKGVVRPNAGHMVALAWTMRNIYAVEPGEVFWAASDVGWVVGHSYICYGAAARRRHHRRLRGQAGGHARRRHLLAGDRRARRAELLHRPDRLPRDQARGPRRASW